MNLDELKTIDGTNIDPDALNTYDGDHGDRFIYTTKDYVGHDVKVVIEVDHDLSVDCDDCDFRNYFCNGINCNAKIVEYLKD